MEKGYDEMRFGMVAVLKKFVTADHVIEALRIQVEEDLSKGKHRLIGEILVDEGHMTNSQRTEVLELMGISIQ